MANLPGKQYRLLTRLREETRAPFDEKEVQRFWFEQVYKNPLITTGGESVEILQPGFWNSGGGPDFHHAAIRMADGSVECGSVEIHLRPEDWKHHHHDADPAYDRVILHVFWEQGPKPFDARTSRKAPVRQVELSTQMKLPAGEVRRLFHSTPGERSVGARVGRCQAELAKLPDDRVVALLEEAGWFRFQGRMDRWRARSRLLGEDQALWLGLADALGYAANREPFRWLARRWPVGELLRVRSNEKREALLFGAAGFLPSTRLPAQAAPWARSLWDHWWKHREEGGGFALSSSDWSRHGMRPLNRPERRLAVLSLLSGGKVWKEWKRLAVSGEPVPIGGFLGDLSHPFWDRRCSLSGKVLAKRAALLGPARVGSILYNVVWPMAAGKDPDRVRGWLEKSSTGMDSHSGDVAALRLLAGRKLKGKTGSLLIREGLLQVYQDFCLEDASQCAGCSFPELVAHWKRATG